MARYVLMGATVLLVLGGLVMVYSASSAADFARYGDSAYHLKKQFVFIAVGALALVLCLRSPYEKWRTWGWWVLAASDIGLVAVLVIGYASHGAKSWIDLGYSSIQPSEFAKLGVIVALAAVFADRQRHPRPIREDLRTLALIVVPVVVLIMMQPDMGTTMSILIPVVLLAVVAGLEWRYLLMAAAGLGVAAPLMALVKSYRWDRVTTFLDPWTDPLGRGYQTIQSLLAFGSGGVLGLGLGLSRQKFFYLPEAQSDFIFAIIGEELGLIGTLSVVAAFAAIAWAGLRIAASVKDPFGRLLASGLTITIVVQAIMNMAATTNLMPVTGIPLPLVSYGGSSMLFTMACVGLILSVARQGRGRAAASGRSTGGSDEESDSAGTGERGRNGRPRLSVVDGGRAPAGRRAL
ncbi:MAG: putative lipid II flippase FtsW [Coriobacteriia bacterium]|nr:putative lipid II flippase FtsW [Coriobacteriia bacterium]